MEQIPTQRLRLWLRAERALGLTHVVAPPLAVLQPGEISARTPADSTVEVAASSPVAPRARPESTRPLPQTPSAVLSLTPTALSTLPALDRGESVVWGDERSAEAKATALRNLDETQVRGCTKCPLCTTRRHTVFGEGDPTAQLMFVGEGPGSQEDETGRPFVGKAGQKLTEMIAAMGLSREQVFISNVVKCRAFLPGPPPKDRPPVPEEAGTCLPYLHQQIEIIRPRVIVTLGVSAMQYLLGVKQQMSRARGNWFTWHEIPVMPTFHPSYILRNPTRETRGAVWSDLKQVMTTLRTS